MFPVHIPLVRFITFGETLPPGVDTKSLTLPLQAVTILPEPSTALTVIWKGLFTL